LLILLLAGRNHCGSDRWEGSKPENHDSGNSKHEIRSYKFGNGKLGKNGSRKCKSENGKSGNCALGHSDSRNREGRTRAFDGVWIWWNCLMETTEDSAQGSSKEIDKTKGKQKVKGQEMELISERAFEQISRYFSKAKKDR
jgi:hypothetical protein